MPPKLMIQYVKSFVHNHGYEMISDEYINVDTKIKLKCPNGHVWNVVFKSFKKGVRCRICNGQDNYTSSRRFHELVENKGYKLLTKYHNNKKKVVLECPKGHVWDVSPVDFTCGNRCRLCSGKDHAQSKVNFMGLLEKEGYCLISEYTKNSENVTLRCPNGHLWSVTPSNFRYSYQRCPQCRGSAGQRLL